MRGPDTIAIGACRRIIINNLVAYNVDPRHGAIISGLPGHDIEDLQLSNIRIYYRGGGPKDSIRRIVPEFEKDYPEPYRWKIMPSYGFFLRHVKNLKMHDVQISYMKEDPRPPFVLDDVKNATLYDIQAMKANGAPVMLLKNVQDLTIYRMNHVKDMQIKSSTAKEL
jgi:hypothetical protein